MLLRYNLEKLEKVISDFYKLTGISIAITDTDFHQLVHCRPAAPDAFCRLIQSSPTGVKRCIASDCALLTACKEAKGTCTHTCHAGLTDTGVAITDKGVILGYVIFGQVYDSSRTIPRFSEIYPRVADLGLPHEELEEAYNRILFVDKETIESASELVGILTKYIWLEHMIHPEEGDMFSAIAEYVTNNLTEDLEVGALCRRFHLSKNALYKLFHKNTGYTVNEYVTNHRIDKAKTLLCHTTLPVCQVSEAAGIENYQYFCRLFKKSTGISPLQYRKKNATT